MAEPINPPMRKAIKNMCIVCQTAQFVSLMPKPKDFVTRVVSDIVYLSSLIQDLSDKMNKMLDEYSDIPVNYLMTNVNSLSGSLTRTLDRVNKYTQNAINQTFNVAENSMDIISEISGNAVDIYKETSKAVDALALRVAGKSTTIDGVDVLDELEDKLDEDEIKDLCDEILEWTDNKFQTISSDWKNPFDSAGIKNKKEQATSAVNDAFSTASDAVKSATEWVTTLIKELKKKMDDLTSIFDDGFNDFSGVKNITSDAVEKLTEVSTGLKNGENPTPAQQAAAATAEALAKVLRNFSVSKIIKAFAGVLTQVTIVTVGLDKLPPIDVESILSVLKDQAEDDAKGLLNSLKKRQNESMQQHNEAWDEYKKKNNIKFESSNNYADMSDEDKEYSDKSYQEFLKQYEEERVRQRKENRQNLKKSRKEAREQTAAELKEAITSAYDPFTTVQKERVQARKEANASRKKIRTAKEELAQAEASGNKSAIMEARVKLEQAKNAKKTTKLNQNIKAELQHMKKEAEIRCKKLKVQWEEMMSQYEKAIKEITDFFSGKGDGDKFINDCCEKINQDCTDIKDLCKSLVVHLSSASAKVGQPSDIGLVVPNPGYKLTDLWTDIKTIFKFIKDLIEKVIDILNNVNKLARIMLNGLNNLAEIFKQLMELLGLQWFMDLVQSIIDLFEEKLTESKALLENTLSPVYYKDTDEYEEILERLEKLLTGDEKNYGTATYDKESGISYVSITNRGNDNNYKYFTDSNHYFNVKETRDYYTDDSFNVTIGFGDKEIFSLKKTGQIKLDIEKCLSELEKMEDDIVAYRSPILEVIVKDAKLDNIIDGTDSFGGDLELKGWHYFHPNLNHTELEGVPLFKDIYLRIKSKIIKKAAATGNKKRGGINMLHNKKISGSAVFTIKSDIHSKGGKTYSSTSADEKGNKTNEFYNVFFWYDYMTNDLEDDTFDLHAQQDKVVIGGSVKAKNGVMVQLADGRMAFVPNTNIYGATIRSGDYVKIGDEKFRVR